MSIVSLELIQTFLDNILGGISFKSMLLTMKMMLLHSLFSFSFGLGWWSWSWLWQGMKSFRLQCDLDTECLFNMLFIRKSYL